MSRLLKFVKKRIPTKIKGKIKAGMKKVYEITPMHYYKVKHGDYVRKSFGKADPDKTYMVLTRADRYAGIYSDYIVFLMGLGYVCQKGYIPVIDRLTIPAFEYQEPNDFGKNNGWELYFEQPAGITVQEVFRDKKNVLIYDVDSRYNWGRFRRDRNNFLKETDRWLAPYKEIAKIQLKNNKKVQECIDREYNRVLAGKNNVIGVAIREGYNKFFYYHPDLGDDHPIQPEINEVVKIVSELMKKWGGGYIFLTCETVETTIAFKEKFGDMVLYTNRERDTRESLRGEAMNGCCIAGGIVDRQTRTIDYIVEMNLLARCDYLVCGVTSGTIAVKVLKNGQFKDIYIIDKGIHKAGKKDVRSW